MPTAFVYFGLTGVDVLRFKSQSDFGFKKFPYTYSEAIFNKFVSPEDFYLQVLSNLSKRIKVKLTPQNTVIGLSPYMHLDIEGYEAVKVLEILKNEKSANWVLVDGFSVITSDDFVSKFPYKQGDYGSTDTMNYFSNKALFPQTIFDDPSSFDYFDDLYRRFIPELKIEFDGKKPVIYSGDRFKFYTHNEGMSYLLMLDFIRGQAFHSLVLDDSNKFNLSLMFKYRFKSEGDKVNSLLESLEDVEYIPVGTLLNTQGEAEVLFETNVGSSQFVKLGENKIFVFPLYSEESARVVVSNKILGDLEREVSGGKLGFVVDTRNKQDPKYLEDSFRQPFLKDWLGSFEEAKKGF